MLDEFKDLFYSKLDIGTLDFKEQSAFLAAMVKYLDHGRKDKINGRTLEFVSRQLDSLIRFFESVGYTKKEMVQILTNLPSLLNTVDDLYKKYLLLGVVENPYNTLRKDKLLHRTKDFIIGFNKIYARYKLVCEAGYDNPNWNVLVHASDREFAKIFVVGTYKKSYQVFTLPERVLEWLNGVSTSEFDLEQTKSWDVNKEIVEKYEERSKRNS